MVEAKRDVPKETEVKPKEAEVKEPENKEPEVKNNTSDDKKESDVVEGVYGGPATIDNPPLANVVFKEAFTKKD